MELLLTFIAGLLAPIAIFSAVSPARIAYKEEITIQAPVAQVYDDSRLQDRLMRWSA